MDSRSCSMTGAASSARDSERSSDRQEWLPCTIELSQCFLRTVHERSELEMFLLLRPCYALTLPQDSAKNLVEQAVTDDIGYFISARYAKV